MNLVSSILRSLAKPIAKPFFLNLFNLFQHCQSASSPTAILTYHSLDESGSVISLSPEKFYRQMKFLHSRGYRVYTLKEYAELLGKRQPVIKPSVVLTFDDGYANFMEEAYPILRKYNYRATVFIQTDYIGKRSSFTLDLDLPLMGPEAIALLAVEGFEIGSHTLSHSSLPRISLTRAEIEIARSKEVLENLTGRKVHSFCYPRGEYNREIIELVKKTGYQAAVTLNPGNKNSSDDLFALRRVTIRTRDELAYFRVALGPFFDIYNRWFQL